MVTKTNARAFRGSRAGAQVEVSESAEDTATLARASHVRPAGRDRLHVFEQLRLRSSVMSKAESHACSQTDLILILRLLLSCRPIFHQIQDSSEHHLLVLMVSQFHHHVLRTGTGHGRLPLHHRTSTEAVFHRGHLHRDTLACTTTIIGSSSAHVPGWMTFWCLTMEHVYQSELHGPNISLLNISLHQLSASQFGIVS
jgi:hypothetical protein